MNLWTLRYLHSYAILGRLRTPVCETLKHKFIFHRLTMNHALYKWKYLMYESPQPPYFFRETLIDKTSCKNYILSDDKSTFIFADFGMSKCTYQNMMHRFSQHFTICYKKSLYCDDIPTLIFLVHGIPA